MALGMNKMKVFLMILFETFFLVFTATPIGTVLGLLTVMYFGHRGIDQSASKAALESFGMSTMIYPVISFRDVRIMLELVILTSILSAIFPARKALSLIPSDAIRK